MEDVAEDDDIDEYEEEDSNNDFWVIPAPDGIFISILTW